MFVCTFPLPHCALYMRKPARVNIQIPTCSPIITSLANAPYGASACQDVEACDELLNSGI